MSLFDLAFWTLAATLLLWLIWEFIPGVAKEYWLYLYEMRKNLRARRKPGRYSFTFKVGSQRKNQ